MADVQANYRALVAALGFTSDEARRRSQTLAGEVLAEWSSIARQQLRTTRPAYLSSLQVRDVSEHGFVVGLPAGPSTAVLAHMIEQGMGPAGIGSSGPYDVRQFLLRSGTRNLRLDKRGRPYVNVPFTRTKDQVRDLGGDSLAARAQRLKATVDTAQGTAWGGRLPAGLVPLARPHHVADLAAGMVRLASTYSAGQGGRARTQTTGYRTWRRASFANRRPMAWVSKGIVAHRYADQVLQRLPALIARVYS